MFSYQAFQTITMETLPAHWLSTMGMEDIGLVNQSNEMNISTVDLSTVSIESQSSESLNLGNSFIDMDHVKDPTMEFSDYNYGLRFSESTTCFERPPKIPRLNAWGPYSSSQNSFSSSSIYTPDSSTVSFSIKQQNSPSSHLEYFANESKSNNERYEALTPKTPAGQAEMLTSKLSSTAGMLQIANMGKSYLDRNVATHMKNPIATPRISTHTQDHIMAERKRRERLSQKFIALSAIIPGLKKMDKASVLEDAIKYVKRLQDRLNVLEQQTSKNTVQSVIYVNKCPLGSEDEESSVNNHVQESGDKKKRILAPEIEARIVERNVLIRIHCEKKKGLLAKFLAELDKLQMTIVNANILTFSEATLDLTLTVQMEEGCSLTVKEIVKRMEEFLKRTSF